MSKSLYRRARVFRERLEQRGPEALTDAELLSVLGVDAGASALFELGRMEVPRLVEDVGYEGAHAVLAAIELGRRVLRAPDRRPRLKSTHQMFLYLEPGLAARRQEHFRVLCLNSGLALLADVEVAMGTQDGCLVDLREVFSAALAVHAGRVVLAHNHPSGELRPSEGDIVLTRQAIKVGRMLGISVLDHLVLGAGQYLSMAASKLCRFR